MFDNCEHVLDAAADLIEAILARSGTVRVLATSREGLRLTGEQLWPVPSLDVGSSAATLFADRASAVAPATSVHGDQDAVTEICRRVDGIPLAIELAASRLLSMTVSEVRDHLDDRFRLLVGSRRGLERHQTLRHAVQWSYDLLDADEKTMLVRCSVFAGGFDLAAAQAVSHSVDRFAALNLLDALVRKSLLLADQSAGRTRFSMLETIRQFAEEQLVQIGEADDTRNAHAHYFAGREADVLALWDGPRQRDAYDWLNIEFANLRTAFRWSADSADLDTASAIATYAAFLGTFTEQYEPIGWAEELVEHARAANHPRLGQLYIMAAQCYETGRLDDALSYAEAGLAHIRRADHVRLPYEAEAFLGGVYVSHGRPERWVEMCREAIAHDGNAAADMIEKILRRSSTVSILVTSREGLRLNDERIWPIPSLDIESSATQLFAERALAVGAALASTDDRNAVSEICRRLDGIPLAIELAASRMQSMTVTELQGRLHERFRLLTGARRGLERHQTLRHAVQWSYDLLEAQEKALLSQISVFSGGFDLAGACAVSGCDDEFATLDVLDALVRKSLLLADRSSGQTRFSMLETIRQFAEEQLVSAGEKPAMRATRAPGATPDGKLMSWHCGTARANARRTNGSFVNYPICAALSGGLWNAATWTPAQPSRSSPGWSVWVTSCGSQSVGRRS